MYIYCKGLRPVPPLATLENVSGRGDRGTQSSMTVVMVMVVVVVVMVVAGRLVLVLTFLLSPLKKVSDGLEC